MEKSSRFGARSRDTAGSDNGREEGRAVSNDAEQEVSIVEGALVELGRPVIVGDDHMVVGHFEHLPVHCNFIALMPQWDPLDPRRLPVLM